MTHIEAMNLALETLERASDSGYSIECDEAIAAIKEALAEQQKKPAYRAVKTFHEGKPVYVAELSAPPTECQTEAEKTAFAFGWFKALESVRLQPPQPPVAKPHEQEPVAREPNDAELLKAFTRSNNGPNPFYRCNTCGDTEPGVREYLSNHWLKHNNTSPPQRQWQGLSDEEAIECWPGLAMYADCAKFWENIEAKLKAKNDN